MIAKIIAGAVFLLIGGSFWGYLNRRGRVQRAVGLVLAWLLIALGTAFLLLAFFPESTASGTLLNVQVGGATAAFALVWGYGLRATRSASADGQLAPQLESAKLEIERLQSELVDVAADAGPIVLADKRTYAYEVVGAPGRTLGLITGDLLNVHDADVWVNSENTNMQMSRYFEQTISATIRYYGATRDPVTGEVLADTIAQELAAARGTALTVQPCAVLSTGPGALLGTHGVKALLHVAAVQGEPAAGYRCVADVGRCVTAVLDSAEALPPHISPTSVVLPLLGTGSGKAGLEPTVKALLLAASNWLASGRAQRVKRVTFLAYRDAELRACRSVLADLDKVRQL